MLLILGFIGFVYYYINSTKVVINNTKKDKKEAKEEWITPTGNKGSVKIYQDNEYKTYQI